MRKVTRYGRLRLDIQVSSLSNGVIIASARDATAKEVSLGIGIRDGSRYESESSNGSRHFLEHMIFKGSSSVSGSKLAEAVEYSGAHYNAWTDREHILYELNAPSWNKARAVFPLYADAVMNPSFGEEDVIKERKVVTTELKRYTRDDPDSYAEEIAYSLFFPKQSLGLPIGGSEKTLSTMGARQLHKIHNKYYTPKRIVVVGAGLLRHQELVRLTEQTLGSLTPRKINDYFSVHHQQKNGRVVHISSRASNESSYLLIGFDVSRIMDRQNDKSAFILLASILGNGFSSRLFRALRAEQGIGYGVGMWCVFSKSFVLAFIGIDCHIHDDLDRAEHIAKEEIQKIQTTPVSRREIHGHITQLRRDIRDEIDDTDALRDELFYHILVGRPQDLYSEYHHISQLTPADIQRTAQQHLDLNNYVVVRVEGGPEPETISTPAS